MASDPVTILHLSDPQFGKNHAFGGDDHLPSDRDADGLGARLIDDLELLRKNPGLKPDIVLVTGDITEWGRPSEFKIAKQFLEQIASYLHLDRRRTILLPGNHDISRTACQAYFLKCESDEVEPMPPYWPKLQYYAAFHNEWYQSTPAVHYTEDKSWSLFELDDLRVAVAALNSDVRESHQEDDHYGWVGEKQCTWFATELEKYKAKGWLRIAAVHHNIVRGAVADDENLRDVDTLKRRVFPHVNILFHGHTHNGGKLTLVDQLPILATGSAGVIQSARPKEVPNQYQIVRIYADRIEQFARQYSVQQSKWIGDNRVSTDGDTWRPKMDVKLGLVAETFRLHRLKAKSPSSVSLPRKSVSGTSDRGQKLGSLTALRLFFSTGTAENEGDMLQEAFVASSDYVEIVTPPPASPRILVGKKGSGKSAFSAYFLDRMRKANVPALLLRPDDIQVSDSGSNATVGTTKARSFEQLVRTVAVHLWIRYPALLSEEDKKVLLEVDRESSLSNALLTRLVQVLGKLGAESGNVDARLVLGEMHSESSGEAFRNLATANAKILYVLIDDTDQVASPAVTGHLNRIWGFLLAVRRLATACVNIKFIVTLRSEIWRRLEVDPLGQRDQMDHFRPLIHRINPSKLHIQRILERRLQIARTRVRGTTGDSVYSPFFEGKSVKIPTSKQTSSWKEFILVRSRGRPRDAIQLVALLAKLAVEREATKINSEHVEAGMIEFSEGRARDISAEVGEDCPQFFTIVTSLWELPFKSGVEEVRQHLSKLPSRFPVLIGGVAMRQDREQDILKIWLLLYESGVINARVADARETDGFRHVDPLQDPNLVSSERWNDMQSAIWEINPAYRDFLIQARQAEESREGLPPMSKKNDNYLGKKVTEE